MLYKPLIVAEQILENQEMHNLGSMYYLSLFVQELAENAIFAKHVGDKLGS